jgi:Tol biopolymer transport system component
MRCSRFGVQAPLRLIAKVATLGLATGLLVASSAMSAPATFPGKNGRIAFLNSASRFIAVYSMNPDGSDRVRLTEDLSESVGDSTYTVSAPAWSSDGSRIAYAALPLPSTDIFTMDADGSSMVNLTHSDAFEGAPAWSPSGRRLVFERGTYPNTDIYRIDEDGSDMVALTTGRAFDLRPDWSPDGGRIAFDSNRSGDLEIYTMAPDGSHVVRLTNRPHRLDADPSWSPDGTKIAFASSVRRGFAIFVMNTDGTGITRLTESTARNTSPSWSPDGTKIAFESDRNLGSDIFVIDADGERRAEKLTHTSRAEYAPVWQPVPSA